VHLTDSVLVGDEGNQSSVVAQVKFLDVPWDTPPERFYLARGKMYRLKSRAVGRDDGKRPGKPSRAE
jgi:hypothetical protein